MFSARVALLQAGFRTSVHLASRVLRHDWVFGNRSSRCTATPSQALRFGLSEQVPLARMLVFAVDVEVCRRCGGAMRIIAFVTEPAVVTRILAHLERHGIDARAGPWAGAAEVAAG